MLSQFWRPLPTKSTCRPLFMHQRWLHNHVKIKINGTYRGFQLHYEYPHFVPLSATQQVIKQDTSHPLKAKFKRRYANIDPEIMWASFRAPMSLASKGIQRSLWRRRLRLAFFRACKSKSLDKNGRKLDAFGHPVIGLGSPIKGSISLLMTPNFTNLTACELEEDCRKVIQLIEAKWTAADENHAYTAGLSHYS